jgi:hypothetical protein
LPAYRAASGDAAAVFMGDFGLLASGVDRLQNQGGRIAISGNKYDRLIIPDYVTQQSAGKDTVHFAFTEKGHRLVEQVLKGKR